MTVEERLLWQRLRTNKLGGLHFRRQQVIDGFIADFYCHAAGVVVEVDGPVHEGQAEYDAERDRIFRAHGLRVLRLSNQSVLANLGHALTEIARFCEQSRPTNSTQT